MSKWEALVERMLHPQQTITIALAGKYTHLADSYMSVIEALKHAGAHYDSEVNIHLLDMEDFEGIGWERKLINVIEEHDIK